MKTTTSVAVTGLRSTFTSGLPICAVFALQSFAANVAAEEAAENAVRCAEIAFSLSVERRDMSAFLSFIDPDARFVASSVLKGPQEIETGWSVFFSENGPAIRWRPQFIEVLETGDLALSRGPYRIRGVDDAGAVTERWGTYNSVWRLNETGHWQIVFDAGGVLPEPPDAATRDLLEQAVEGCDFEE